MRYERRLNMSESENTFHKKIGDPGAYTDQLVSQLSFIKKKLRYPIDKKKFLPVLTLIPASLFPIFYLINTYEHRHGNLPWLLLLICIFLFVPAIVALFRLRQTFFFVPVRTGCSASENARQLISFFQDNQLRFEQHPEARELFWIMSRSLHRNSDTREVVFFVVDENRILINGHFTDMNRRVPAGSPHHRQMAKKLRKWMIDNEAQKEGLVRR